MTHFLRIRGLNRLFPQGTCALRLSVRSSSANSVRTYQTKWLNEYLVDLVEREQFANAEYIRLHLLSESAPIVPSPAYERAALAQIRWPKTQDLDAFLMWLDLVPDNKYPSRVENGPLTLTRNMLFRMGNPARNLLIIKEFSLVCAAKGYYQLVWDDLVRLMSKFEYPENAVAFFLSFEAALLRYYSKYHPDFVEEAANRQRYLLIMLCCDAEWLEQAVQVVQESTTHRIKQACDRVMDMLRARNDMARLAIVEKSRARNRPTPVPATPAGLDSPKKLSATQRFGNLFSQPPENPRATPPSSPNYSYSTRAISDGSKTLLPRTWIASQLRDVKRMISLRSLAYYRPPGNALHLLMTHYDACKGYPHGLSVLRKRALSASDMCSYSWLCKEMFFLRQSHKYADIVALFSANFDATFLPPGPWHAIRLAAIPSDPLRALNAVPTRLTISRADAWLIWNALVRLAVHLPEPLPVLEAVYHSAVHYAAGLTQSQFCAFPTSYTTVFRSIIWAYGELREVDKAAAVAGDVSVIGKTHATNVGLLDELAGVYARSGDVAAATQLLSKLEKVEPRLATYGMMMDAYLHAGLVEEASKLETRMKQKCQYVYGVNWRMDTTLKALRAAEAMNTQCEAPLLAASWCVHYFGHCSHSNLFPV